MERGWSRRGPASTTAQRPTLWIAEVHLVSGRQLGPDRTHLMASKRDLSVTLPANPCSLPPWLHVIIRRHKVSMATPVGGAFWELAGESAGPHAAFVQ
jgi:hypothetical protein